MGGLFGKARRVSTRQTKDKNKKESKTVDEESVTQVDVKVAEKRDDGLVRIVLISDTHNRHKMLDMPEGDILIHAGGLHQQRHGAGDQGLRLMACKS